MDPLFGSEIRAGVLEQLASTPTPQSAYRIAQSVGGQPIQVLRILKSLGDVAERTTEGWVLSNDLLRSFLRERIARREDIARREKDAILVQSGLRPSWEYGRRKPR
jgi:hypothetical protein